MSLLGFYFTFLSQKVDPDWEEVLSMDGEESEWGVLLLFLCGWFQKTCLNRNSLNVTLLFSPSLRNTLLFLVLILSLATSFLPLSANIPRKASPWRCRVPYTRREWVFWFREITWLAESYKWSLWRLPGSSWGLGPWQCSLQPQTWHSLYWDDFFR